MPQIKPKSCPVCANQGMERESIMKTNREKLRQILIDSTTVLISINGKTREIKLRDITNIAKEYKTTVNEIMETKF